MGLVVAVFWGSIGSLDAFGLLELAGCIAAVSA